MQQRRVDAGQFSINITTTNGTHWMFNDAASGLRLVDWWPSTGTYLCRSGRQGTEHDEDDVLHLAIAEGADKAFRNAARKAGPPGVGRARARQERMERQRKQIYGNGPRPRRRR